MQCHLCQSSTTKMCPTFLFDIYIVLLPTTGARIRHLQERNQSSYIGSLARRVRDLESPSGTSLLKEIYRSDPERVIQIFESQPSLHSNPAALSEYVKALVRVDRLDESALLKTLQRGTKVLRHFLYFMVDNILHAVTFCVRCSYCLFF
jgi:hypothetical protein